MPNWVSSCLIFDNEEEAKKVYDGMQWHGKRFSFKAVCPHPEDRSDCPAEYDQNNVPGNCESEKKPWFNWYNWNIDHWGCKWDCSFVTVDENKITFITPWEPPNDKLLQTIADVFKTRFTIKAWDETEDSNGEPLMFPTRQFMNKEP